MIRKLIRYDPVLSRALRGSVAIVLLALMGQAHFNHAPPEWMIVVLLLVGGILTVGQNDAGPRYLDFVAGLPVTGSAHASARLLAVLAAGLLLIWPVLLVLWAGWGFPATVLRAAVNMTAAFVALSVWVAVSARRWTRPRESVMLAAMPLGVVAIVTGVGARNDLYWICAAALSFIGWRVLRHTVPPALELAPARPRARAGSARAKRRRRAPLARYLLREVFWQPGTMFLPVEMAIALTLLALGNEQHALAFVAAICFARHAESSLRLLPFLAPLPVSMRRIFFFATLPAVLVVGLPTLLASKVDTAPFGVMLLALAWYAGHWIGMGGIRRLWALFALAMLVVRFADKVEAGAAWVTAKIPAPGAWIVCALLCVAVYESGLRRYRRAYK